jgi:hypothetical protein
MAWEMEMEMELGFVILFQAAGVSRGVSFYPSIDPGMPGRVRVVA